MRTLAQVDLKRRDREAIEEAVGVLRERFPEIFRVILFGSKARGDDDAESDVDLLVLTRRRMRSEDEDEMRHAIYDIVLRSGVMLSPIIVSEDQWERGSWLVMPIRGEIDRDGVEL